MMHRATLLLAITTLATTVRADEPQGSATLPLGELLRLHQTAAAAPQESRPPPVRFAVSHFVARGRIVGDAIEATASVQLQLFADGCSSVPLLERDPGLDITDLPNVEGGHFVHREGALHFVGERRGGYAFEIGFIKRASRRAGAWALELRLAQATIRKLILSHDESLFEVTNGGARREGDTLVLFAAQDTMRLGWRDRRTTVRQPETPSERPPVEPVVTQGEVSVVVTLDGRRITRALYRLRMEGAQPLTIDVPTGQRLTKVYLNGRSLPFTLTGAQAAIRVAPPRLGDQSAVVEVVLMEEGAPMALAGTLSFTLPTLSWSVHRLSCLLSLPDLFNYTWVGGSLSPGAAEMSPTYTFEIPTPGKSVAVTQQLVNGAPDTVIDYAVDLTDNYFDD